MSGRSEITIGVGIVGYGFMGRTHLAAYQSATRAGFPCRVRAICDRRGVPAGGSATGNLAVGEGVDLAGIAIEPELNALLADPAIDLISLCTPTDTHIELAQRALAAGKHVLVEKPVGITAEAIEPLMRAAESSDRLCMPAMCMRFWPAWVKAAEMLRDLPYGRLRSASFVRAGARPDWAPEFYGDESRCGGMLCDLHIHDTDFIVSCLGMPRAVVTTGHAERLSTQYDFGNPDVSIRAEGGWDLPASAGFRMRFLLAFERAAVEFDINHEHQLRVFTDAGEEHPALAPIAGYDGEVRALVRAIERGDPQPPVTMRDAWRVARVVDAERQSLLSARPVEVPDA